MRFVLSFTALAIAAAALTACGGSDLADSLNIGSPRARLVNAMPNGPSVQLYRNDNLQTDAGTLAYEQASKYFDTVTATSTWSLRDASAGTQVGSTSMRVVGSTRYTLVAFPGAGTQADMVQFSDPYDFALGKKNARLRVVNGSANAGAVDVYVTALNADLSSATPVIGSVGYEGVGPSSGADSYVLGAGSYKLVVTAAGTKTIYFEGTLTAKDDDDLLLVTLPTSSTSGGIKVLEVPSDSDESNFEIPG